MKKALVTGGAGFIGSHVVKQLVEMGIKVCVFDNLSTGKIEYLKESEDLARKNGTEFSFSNTDLRYDNLLDKLHPTRDPDTIFHLAALPRVEPSIKDPMPHHEINVEATLKVLEYCRKRNIKNLVFSSSSSIYGDPKTLPTVESDLINCMSPYALHKQVCEEYCKLYSELYGIKCTALRYFNVYGENQPVEGAYVPVVGIWFRQKNANKSLTITGDGTQTRDFVYVKDVAKANILAATVDNDKMFNSYNVGAGKNYCLNDVAKFISPNIKYIEKRHEPHTTLASNVKIATELGWRPKMDLFDWITQKGFSRN
jgi:UDP-glucose 4-epimerase